MPDRTKTAVSGASIPQDHEGGRPVREALAKVRTMRLLADGVKLTLLEECKDLMIRFTGVEPFFQPGRFSGYCPRAIHHEVPAILNIRNFKERFILGKGDDVDRLPDSPQDFLGDASQKGMTEGALSMGPHDDCVAL